MVCTCQCTIDSIKGKKILRFDCEKSLANASITNTECLAHVASFAEQKPDEIVLRKDFQRIYSGDNLKEAIELAAVSADAMKDLQAFKGKLCEKCKKVYERTEKLSADPVKMYHCLSTAKLCNICSHLTNNVMEKAAKQMKESNAMKKILATGADSYHSHLRPMLVPSVVTSNIELQQPSSKSLDKYGLGNCEVNIFKGKDRPDSLYFIRYPEIRLNNEDFKALQDAFKEATKEDISSEPKVQLENIANQKFRGLKDKDILKEIFLRHTTGYGLIEPLLRDENITDVFVDSGSRMVHIVHSKFGECTTNVNMSKEDLEKLATRLRAVSGRPFDASSPVLHTELEEFGIRVAGICEPSTYKGMGFAFRRRKEHPWTLPEFCNVGMLNPEAAGLINFLMDGQASILIVGPRGSGKTSLLVSLLLEVAQNNRIIAIEDTPEIPVDYLRSLGFKVEHLKVEAFAKGYELSAEDALRTSLRLGESILVLGEVRGQEAKALFEAMRIGAVGNVVIGTIHGSSPYDAWDRITNDLGVPSTSFKATDIILTTNTIREGDSPIRKRRLTGITEVRKDWSGEPKFFEIAKYNRKKDKLEFENFWKSETIRKIAGVKGMTKQQVAANLKNRIEMKKHLLAAAKKNPKALESESLVAANSRYVQLIQDKKKVNYPSLLNEWKQEIKKN